MGVGPKELFLVLCLRSVTAQSLCSFSNPYADSSEYPLAPATFDLSALGNQSYYYTDGQGLSYWQLSVCGNIPDTPAPLNATYPCNQQLKQSAAAVQEDSNQNCLVAGTWDSQVWKSSATFFQDAFQHCGVRVKFNGQRGDCEGHPAIQSTVVYDLSCDAAASTPRVKSVGESSPCQYQVELVSKLPCPAVDEKNPGCAPFPPPIAAASLLPGVYEQNPSLAAQAIAQQITQQDRAPSGAFGRWGYGQSIILDAMLLTTEKLQGSVDLMDKWVNPILDSWLDHGAAADLVAGVTPTAAAGDDAIGDSQGPQSGGGLYPHAYLHRAMFYNRSTATRPPASYHGIAADVLVAKNSVDRYTLNWPIRWADGAVTRDTAGKAMVAIGWRNTSQHQYVWGDDAYMGITTPARLVIAGLDTPTHSYAEFVAAQHQLAASHLVDPSDGLFWHGKNVLTHEASCCKWGRANGWTMMGHVETLLALSTSDWPGAAAAHAAAVHTLQQHAAALAAHQSTDGRWHQIVNNRSTFLESSGTAMYLVAMVQAVQHGWLNQTIFTPVIRAAWKGLARAIQEDGVVEGICDGFGLHPYPTDYEQAHTWFNRSQPGLGSVLKAAVLIDDFL